MDDIFNFLNSTYEAGQTIFNGQGKIIGYANNGAQIDGVFQLGNDELPFLITNSEDASDTTHYTFRLERGGQSYDKADVSAGEIIQFIKSGSLTLA